MIFNFNNKTMFAALAACTAISTAAVAGGMEDAPAAAAGNNGSLASAISNGTAYVDARYRFEYVDQDGFADEAKASTLRTNLGYKTGTWNDLSAVLEVQNVTELGADDYNDTLNGDARPVIADPTSTEVNEAKLIYTGIQDTTVIVGRQKINVDNQRFVGTVGWRQNDQTFDAAALVNNSIEDVTALYAFIDNVNRINGDDHGLGNLGGQTHVANLAYTGSEYGKLTGYGVFIDLDDAAVSSLSSKTYGLRFAGKAGVQDGISVTYAAEYAIQSDHGDNAADYDADYYVAELGLAGSKWNALVGYEVLGADGTAGVFQTPLATGHAFNGWADKFLSTPANGLEDLYVKASYNCEHTGATLTAAYHQFDAEQGGADYGNEINVQLSKEIDKNYSVAVKYANYDADQFSTDTEKFWLVLGAKF